MHCCSVSASDPASPLSDMKPLFCGWIPLSCSRASKPYYSTLLSTLVCSHSPRDTTPHHRFFNSVSMMATDNQNNVQQFKPTDPPQKTTSASTEPARRPKQQHHWDRTYQCLTVYSEYDCGHELPLVVRDPRCWKCEDLQPRLCRPSDWDIGADGLCPDCAIVKRQEELARQRRLARGLKE